MEYVSFEYWRPCNHLLHGVVLEDSIWNIAFQIWWNWMELLSEVKGNSFCPLKVSEDSWLGLTSIRLGRPGNLIGLENSFLKTSFLLNWGQLVHVFNLQSSYPIRMQPLLRAFHWQKDGEMNLQVTPKLQLMAMDLRYATGTIRLHVKQNK